MEGCGDEKTVENFHLNKCHAPIVVKNVNRRRRLRRHYVQVAESFLRSISLDGLYNNADTLKGLNSTDCSPVGKWSSEADQSKASEAPLSELEKVSNFNNVDHHDLDIVGRDRAFTLQSTYSLGVDSVEFMSGRISSNFSKSSVSSLGKSLLKPTSEAAGLDSSTLASSCGMDLPFLDHASVDSENAHLACHDVDVSGPTSIMDIFDPAEAKRESNTMFQRKYPDIQLTYSKYISLRREMKSVMLAHDGDLVVLAQAYCYFDQIVLKLLVDKTNRKLVAAGCLLLAAKINDYKGNQLKVIIENIEDRFRLSRKDLFKYELPLASALEFELNLPALYVEAHYQKLLWAS
ncbi:CDK5 and ABL1 enzyme substrate 1 [Trichinella zimbabwensis]|uniref:CDK5 and ABL1 enzyme substrate 1 n=1 Tax=Trichinella zimbabwensis TaxID=268475 RepID=A0A0V1HV98_9BILA|nr:CDK5 and ABL1 enzyme substrate 1 [Trichinella zimbabwensis]